MADRLFRSTVADHQEKLIDMGDGSWSKRVVAILASSSLDVSERAFLAQLQSSELIRELLAETKLLNARFEEAFKTGVNTGDI